MNQSVIVVIAHPDDAEWYCGGAIAKLEREGAEIRYVICTEGDKGSYDPRAKPLELAARRKLEQEAAAELLGVKAIFYLGYPDGMLQPSFELRQRLAILYRKYRPELLITFDPWRRFELHPDHRAAGIAALDARLAAKMPLFYPNAEGLGAWATPELWLFDTEAPNHFVDVGETFDLRVKALMLHASQTVGDAENVQFVTDAARAAGEKAGSKYAEEFHRIVIEGSIAR